MLPWRVRDITLPLRHAESLLLLLKRHEVIIPCCRALRVRRSNVLLVIRLVHPGIPGRSCRVPSQSLELERLGVPPKHARPST